MDDKEDSFFRLQQQHWQLKKEAFDAKNQVKQLNTKVARLLHEKKRAFSKESIPGRDVEMQEVLYDMNSRVSHLQRENERLRDRTLLLQTQFQETLTSTRTRRIPFTRSKSFVDLQRSPSFMNINTSNGLYSHVQSRVDSGLKKKTDFSGIKSHSCLSLNRISPLQMTPRNTATSKLRPITAFTTSTRPRIFQSIHPSQPSSRDKELVKIPIKSYNKVAAQLLTEARDEIQSLEQVVALQQSLIDDREGLQQQRPSTSRGHCEEKQVESSVKTNGHENLGENLLLDRRKSIDQSQQEYQDRGRAVTKTTITSPSGGILFSTDVSRGLDTPHVVFRHRRRNDGVNGNGQRIPDQSSSPGDSSSQSMAVVKVDSDQQLQQQLKMTNHKVISYIDSLRKQLKEEQDKNNSLVKQLQTEKSSNQSYQHLTRRIDELLRENEILQESLNKCMASAFDQIKDSSSGTSTVSATDSSMSHRTRALIEGLHQQLRVTQSRLEVVDSKRRGLEQQLHQQSSSNIQLSEENERLKTQVEQLILSVTTTTTAGHQTVSRNQEEQYHSLPPFSSSLQDQNMKDRIIQMQRERDEVLREFTQMKNMLEQIQVSMKESEKEDDDDIEVQQELEGAVGGEDDYEDQSDFEDRISSPVTGGSRNRKVTRV
jgi:hypothetical protein